MESNFQNGAPVMQQVYKERMLAHQGGNKGVYEFLLDNAGQPFVGLSTVPNFRPLTQDGTCRFREIRRMAMPFVSVFYFRKKFPYRKLFNRK